MKILTIADEESSFLWDYHHKDFLRDIDLIISCGDLKAEYLSYLVTMCRAPLFYVCGNHDDNYAVREPEGCECIEDRLITYQGLRILGLGGSQRYKEGVNQYTERQMARRAARLRGRIRRAGGLDILVSHAPALGIGDGPDIAHRGFQTFVDIMDQYEPAYMLHGHWHASYTYRFQRVREYGPTQIINAYESYVLEI